MKLGLGTAQFGFKYGITNKRGQVPIEEIGGILDHARQAGFSVIDTATLYGNSEEVLGRCLPQDHQFQIITKTKKFNKAAISPEDAKDLVSVFHNSLKDLRQKTLYGLLVHHAEDLLAENGHLLIDSLNDLKRQKLVQKIGVSVYSADQIDRLLDGMDIDLIQLPVNVLDQRLLISGHLKKLKQRGVEIHARSIFLQGVLLKQPRELDSYFNPVKGLLEEYHAYLAGRNITPVESALRFIMAQKEIDCMVLGVSSQDELSEIEETLKTSSTSKIDHARFACSDKNIIDPSTWHIIKSS